MSSAISDCINLRTDPRVRNTVFRRRLVLGRQGGVSLEEAEQERLPMLAGGFAGEANGRAATPVVTTDADELDRAGGGTAGAGASTPGAM